MWGMHYNDQYSNWTGFHCSYLSFLHQVNIYLPSSKNTIYTGIIADTLLN